MRNINTYLIEKLVIDDNVTKDRVLIIKEFLDRLLNIYDKNKDDIDSKINKFFNDNKTDDYKLYVTKDCIKYFSDKELEYFDEILDNNVYNDKFVDNNFNKVDRFTYNWQEYGHGQPEYIEMILNEERTGMNMHCYFGGEKFKAGTFIEFMVIFEK